MKLASYYLFALLTIISLSASYHTQALPDDKDQPINIVANKAYKNDKKGITTYEGDVVITQGSIRVSGKKVTVYDAAGTVDKIIAIGSPARFKQTPEVTSTVDMIAQGDTIEYDLKQETLTMLNNAQLQEAGRVTNSNKITYDMQTAIVKAGDDSGRVKMTLEPSK